MTDDTLAAAAGARALELLPRLVEIDSRNPVLAPGAPGEDAVVKAIAAVLWAAGLEVAVVEPEAGRPSVIGVRPGSGGGRTLLLNGPPESCSTGISTRSAPAGWTSRWSHASTATGCTGVGPTT